MCAGLCGRRGRSVALKFEELLGNTRLKQGLMAAAGAGKLSHSYLISGPAGSGRHTLATLLAAAMECTGEQRPCMVCRACRKVCSGNHPDVITVDEPGKAQVPVDCIRKARAEAFIRPNEGTRKIFLIPRAGEMNPAAQNALLKVLEEPPPYGAFLLLATGPEQLLPTIRSRCVELRLAPLDEPLLCRELSRRFPARTQAEIQAAARRSGGFLGQAIQMLDESAELLPQTLQFARAYAAHDTLALAELFCSLEKGKRQQLTPVFLQIRQLLADALLLRRGAPFAPEAARPIAEAHTTDALLRACGAVQAAMDDCRANVGVGNLCAGLFVQLR